MWFLQNLMHAGFRVSLPIEKDIVIGRKDCDILIPDDTSISRRHAIIRVCGTLQASSVSLTDSKSKFGTFIDKKKLPSGSKATLQGGEELKFGQGPLTGSFKLVFEPLVFCCSSMASADKKKVKQLAVRLGGGVASSWTSSCTHLVMPKLTVTVKVVSALAMCRPVVTVQWLEEAVKCISNNAPLPKVTPYLPEVVEPNLGTGEVSFQPDFKRKRLFEGMIFYFLQKEQHQNLAKCVEAAGAKCQLISTPDSVAMETLVAREAVVLAWEDLPTTPTQQKHWRDGIKKLLEKNKLRAVQDSEIGFALLHVSTDTHCNPRHSPDSKAEVRAPLPPPTLSLSLYDTQSEAPPTSPLRAPTTAPSSLSSQATTAQQADSSSQAAHPQKSAKVSVKPDSTSAIKVPRLPVKRKKSVLEDDFELSPVEIKSKRPRQESAHSNQQKQQQQQQQQQHQQQQSKVSATGTTSDSEKQQGHGKASMGRRKQAGKSTGKQAKVQQQKLLHRELSDIVSDSQPEVEGGSEVEYKEGPLPGLKLRKHAPPTPSTTRLSRAGLRDHDGADNNRGSSPKPDPTSLSSTSILAPNSLTPSGSGGGGVAGPLGKNPNASITAVPSSLTPSVSVGGSGSLEKSSSKASDASILAPNSLTPSGRHGGAEPGDKGGAKQPPPTGVTRQLVTRKRGPKRKNFFVDESSSGESDNGSTSTKGGGADYKHGHEKEKVGGANTKPGHGEEEEGLGDLWGSPLRPSQQPGPPPSPFTAKTGATGTSRSPLSLKGSQGRRGVRSKAGAGVRSKLNLPAMGDGNTVSSSLVLSAHVTDQHQMDIDVPGHNGNHGNAVVCESAKPRVDDDGDDDVILTGVTSSPSVTSRNRTGTTTSSKRKETSSHHTESAASEGQSQTKLPPQKGKKRSPEVIAVQPIPQSSHGAKPHPISGNSTSRPSATKTPRKSHTLPSNSSSNSHTTPRNLPKKFHSPSSSNTPFLSTRKVKKPPVDDNIEDSAITTDLPTTSAFSTQASGIIADSAMGHGSIEKSFTSLSLKRHAEDIPLTAVSTGGRRTKVTVADMLWDQDTRSSVVGGVLEGEDPLGEEPQAGGEGEWPKKVYIPTLSDDGFIMAREPPKLKMGRMARLAQRALNSDLMTSDLSAAAHTADSAVPENTCSQSVAVVVGVEVVQLLRDEYGGCEDGAREEFPDMAGDYHSGRRSRLRDFKKFRKVVGMESDLSRTLTMKLYVPVADQELPDWEVMEDVQEQQASQDVAVVMESDDDGSQDDVFSLGRNRRRQTARNH